MGLRRPPTLPSFRLLPSHSHILRGLVTTRDFRVGCNLLVSSHPPLLRLLQWANVASERSLHSTGYHPVHKFCAVWQPRMIFAFDAIPPFPAIHLTPDCCNGLISPPNASFTRLVTIPFANSARFDDNAQFSHWT